MSDFISFQDIVPSKIECKFSCNQINVIDEITVAVCILKVSGEYPEGSSGSSVGEYLRGLSVFLREVYMLDVLVIDLVDLRYEFGNNLLRMVKPEALQTNKDHNTWLGYYIIGSNNNKKFLSSLFCDFDKGSVIGQIYTSENKVMEDLLNKAKDVYKNEIF